jgi:hypothetical protein
MRQEAGGMRHEAGCRRQQDTGSGSKKKGGDSTYYTEYVRIPLDGMEISMQCTVSCCGGRRRGMRRSIFEDEKRPICVTNVSTIYVSFTYQYI